MHHMYVNIMLLLMYLFYPKSITISSILDDIDGLLCENPLSIKALIARGHCL